MKVSISLMLFLTLTILTGSTSCILKKVTKKQKHKDRKLYENNSSSFLLGDQGTKNSLNHLQMLVNQQKSLQNFKQVGNWLTTLEGKMDDLRDSVNRRLADMGVGLQRKNSLLGHYASMGSSFTGVNGAVNSYMNF